MAATLYHILNTLHRAGGQNVPAYKLPWVVDDFPAINRALDMSYITRLGTDNNSTFSLTRSGYDAIDKEPPPMTAFEVSKKIVLVFFFGRPY